MLFGSSDALPPLTPNWDKLYLDLAGLPQGFEPDPVPLAAIYFLQSRSDDPSAPAIEKQPLRDGLVGLIGNIGGTYIQDYVSPAFSFDLLNRIAQSVPLRRLIPHANPDHLPQLREMVVAEVEALRTSARVLSAREDCSDV